MTNQVYRCAYRSLPHKTVQIISEAFYAHELGPSDVIHIDILRYYFYDENMKLAKIEASEISNIFDRYISNDDGAINCKYKATINKIYSSNVLGFKYLAILTDKNVIIRAKYDDVFKILEKNNFNFCQDATIDEQINNDIKSKEIEIKEFKPTTYGNLEI